jgi:hypothetical protein
MRGQSRGANEESVHGAEVNKILFAPWWNIEGGMVHARSRVIGTV